MSLLQDQFVEIPINSGTYDEKSRGRPASVPEPVDSFILSPMGTPQFKKKKVNWVIDWMSKVSKKTDSFAHGVCEHVKLAPNLSQTMIGKLSLGARILQSGGVKNVFIQNFSVGERELLLKVCQCYLSTTAGPIAGLLFISTENIAFHSERSIKLTSPSGVRRVPYKVLIPLRRISRADPTENVLS
ncbi:hypothetical protein AAC387_Pa07g1257 [Persea americana]